MLYNIKPSLSHAEGFLCVRNSPGVSKERQREEVWAR